MKFDCDTGPPPFIPPPPDPSSIDSKGLISLKFIYLFLFLYLKIYENFYPYR